MRQELPVAIERLRVQPPEFPRTAQGSLYGAFYWPEKKIYIISSGSGPEAGGWEHVSVSHAKRTPTWDEMCRVKDAFWGEDETVVQFHPRASEYVNLHPHTLHLWKRTDGDYTLPPHLFVGPKSTEEKGNDDESEHDAG